MSSTRFIVMLLALLLVFIGGGYAVNHWEDLRARLASAPARAPGPAATSSETVPETGIAEATAAMPEAAQQAAAETIGTIAEGTTSGGEPAKAETRTKKEFDSAAADAAAAAQEAIKNSEPAVTAPAASAKSTTRSIEPPTLSTASLDAVQLSATGVSVIAGQAPAGTKVTLIANDQELATAIADESGAWTMILDEPVAPGSYKLKLAAVGPDGGEAVIREVGEATVAAPVEQTEVAEAPAAPATETSETAPPTTATAQAAATATAETAPAASATAEATATTMAEPAPAAVDVIVPSIETFDIASVPPDLVTAVESPVASTAATDATVAEPEPSTATAETMATATESAASESAATAASEEAATTEATQTAQATESDPSLADQAGEAANVISDMFTDWLNATGDEAEAAAKSFSLAAATYKPIAKGKGVVTLSGRGPPKAEVRLFVDKVAVGATSIADTGRWLAEADHWVEPGEHMARAEIIGADGAVVAGHDLAFTSTAAPDVVADASAGTSETEAEAASPTIPVLLVIADVAYENMAPKKGRITVGGRAEPMSRVTVFADGQRIGAADAAETGDWTVASDFWIDVGAHAIRAERASAAGDVVESTLTEFVRPPVEVEVAAANESEGAADAVGAVAGTEAVAPAVKRKRLAKRKKQRLAATLAKQRKARLAKAGRLRHKLVTLVRGSEVARVRVRLGKRKPGVLGYLRRIGPGWYRVRRGDSLWRIADRCYGDGRHYPVILASNARTIRNPDLIYPRQRLYVP